MCRFLLYHGKQPVPLCDLLTKPVHSIIKQSFDSKLRVDVARPLNGQFLISPPILSPGSPRFSQALSGSPQVLSGSHGVFVEFSWGVLMRFSSILNN